MLLFTNRLTMVVMVDRLVNSAPIQTNPDGLSGEEPRARRRLGLVERERQILDGAIQFFARHGLGGQLRDLARSIGVTHALLYHYFPTKQALIDRVYDEVFAGRWKPEWELWLDDKSLDIEDKLTAFYADYVNTVLTHDFVRILVFSGLTDHTITDRFFSLLGERLFPRLIRETRRYRALTSRAKATAREMELLLGLHGSFFYIGMRRWIYGQGEHPPGAALVYDETHVRDRVRAYLQASRVQFAVNTGPAKTAGRSKPRR